MKTLSLFTGVVLLYLSSCEYQTDSPTPFVPHNLILSRNVIHKDTLPTGTNILFNAQGALNCHNQILTYNGKQWNGQDTLLWEDIPQATTYTALYPVHADLQYSMEQLYTDSGLNDILIAQDTLFKKQNIRLSFLHLFSKLTIQISPDLHQSLKEIQLITPFRISNLSPPSGDFTLIPQEHIDRCARKESRSYSFIIPPMKESSLRLELLLGDQTHSYQLPPYTFESNTQYSCSLHSPIKGIQTANDLIAFSQLINKRNYTGDKTLEDFYTISGNDTIFHLLADIKLTEKDCQQLLPIGYYTHCEFGHIFEGNGHTISYLQIPDRSLNSIVQNQYCGLFGLIGSSGVVRNLNLHQARSTNSPNAKQIGALAASNNGLIINCSVSSSFITNGETTNVLGFICGNNSGYIINCNATHCSMNAGLNSKVGAIAGNATGYILNCYAYNNTFTPKNTSYTGGIVGISSSSQPLTIENCCVYHNKTYNYFGSIIGYPRKDSISHVYYNNGNTYYLESNSYLNHCIPYNSSLQANGASLSQLLNEWIETTGTNKYSQYLFKDWENNENELPTFK